MKGSAELGKHVIALLRGSEAHADFDRAVGNFPVKLRGKRPRSVEHSGWQLLEHMRIAQWDILEFTRNPKHVSPPWPDGYWPETEKPPNATAWSKSIRTFDSDLKAMMRLVSGGKIDLLAKIPHGSGQTLLREALLLADHTSYHVGQMIALRRLLGAWED